MDDIQRKLALIDAQLSGKGDFYKKVVSVCPLVFLAVGLISGIVIQNALELSIVFWLILLILIATAACFFFAIQKSKLSSYLPVFLGFCALICFGCLGAIRLASFYNAPADDIRNLVRNERKLASVRGVIITEPFVNKNKQWQFARFGHSDPTTSFYLETDQIKTVDGWAEVSGLLRVRIAGAMPDLKASNRIEAYCWLDRYKSATNPGQFDIAEYLRRKNVLIAASVPSRDSVKLLKDEPAFSFTRIKTKVKNVATQALLGDMSIEEKNSGLLEALLLGRRSNIGSETHRAFQRTGLLHFISLSGMHFGILVGVVWWLCKTVGLMKRWRAFICIVAIIVFLLIVPPRAPTLRAAIICIVFCVSFFFRRYPNPVNTLSLTAIILLLIKPTNIFEVGWQLSFASVLGILLFCRRIDFLFYRISGKLWQYLLRLFSVGVAAWLGGAGILLYHFYSITPLTSIWTVLVFPLIASILMLGYLKIALMFLLPTVATLLGVVVNSLSDLLIWVVRFIDSLNISQILIGHVPIGLVVFYYVFIIFAVFAYFKRPLIKRIVTVTMFLIVVGFLGTVKLHRTHREGLIVNVLDIGHGQAIVANFPGGGNIIFDAGSLSRDDIGNRIVNSFLDYSGIDKIDCIVISHNDIDHINGIPEIIDHCKVESVYANEAFLSETDRWGTAKFLKDCLSTKGIDVKPLGNSLNTFGYAKIKMLWPDRKTVRDKDLRDNDRSLVLLIEFAGIKMLLCSDIEEFAQNKLLDLYPDLQPQIVVAPHHGSVNTLNKNFFKTLEPDILIYSCSQRHYEKQAAIVQYPAAQSFYTPKDGAITLYVNKNGKIKAETIATCEK